jgi:hypothetical protein
MGTRLIGRFRRRRIAMKRRITFGVATVLFAGLLVVRPNSIRRDAGLVLDAHAQSLNAHDREECTAATFEGTYAYRDTGFNTEFGPFAGVGIFTSDGQGSLIGSGTISRNGEISQAPSERTYVVNPDCTGSVFANDVLVGNFVLYRGGREYFGINMLAGRTITEEGKKQ